MPNKKEQHIVIPQSELNDETVQLVEKTRKHGIGASVIAHTAVAPFYVSMLLLPLNVLGLSSGLLTVAFLNVGLSRGEFLYHTKKDREIAHELVRQGLCFKDPDFAEKHPELKKGLQEDTVTYFDRRGNLVITNRKNLIERYKRWWQEAKQLSAEKELKHYKAWWVNKKAMEGPWYDRIAFAARDFFGKHLRKRK